MSYLQTKLAEAVGQYCVRVKSQIEELNDVLAMISFGHDRQKGFERARAITHKVRGSAASLGFDQLGCEVGKLDDMLASTATPEGALQGVDMMRVWPLIGEINIIVEELRPEHSRLLNDEEIVAVDSNRDHNPLREMSFLVVDDDQSIRHLVRSILQSAGVDEIHLSADGQDALRFTRAHKPDFIISDLNMKPMNGFMLLTTVRGLERPAGSVPFIMLTANGDRRAFLESIRRTADSFVVKPFTAQTLLSHIHTVLERRNETGGPAPALKRSA